jgi:phosphoacetylglucosamine mutase
MTTPFALSKLPTVLGGSGVLDTPQVLALLQAYPLPTDGRRFTYGTAGFRQAADADLAAVVLRTGLCAAARSLQAGGLAVGVMITASHNDASYNGVKIADAHGGMMAAEGEAMALEICNQGDGATAVAWMQAYYTAASSSDHAIIPVVHVGRDTRSHSPAYRQRLVDMLTAVGGRVVDHGVCSTPMLHHGVLHANAVAYLPALIPPRPNVAGYLDLVAYSYLALVGTAAGSSTGSSSPLPALVVDCACGVGMPGLAALVVTLEGLGMPAGRILATNGPGSGPLNEGCGSEHVQKEQEPPQWYEGPPADTSYCASLDGDADRIVFFASTASDGLCLLDGDKITLLFCQFIQEQLATLAPYLQNTKIRLGVVQTAYANGASTSVLQALVGRENVLIAKTGVKHVHHAAHENFDIGVYFEANGHGTILFGPHFYQAVASLVVPPTATAAATALKRLQLLPALVNQAVGDSLSDLLLVDAILRLQNRSLADWHALYTDLPSRQSKVKVPDRTAIETNANETQCLAPAGLQGELQTAMTAVQGRAFVRPSGTEDVVRVYAEAPTQVAADALAKQAEAIIQKYTSATSKI